MVIYQMMNGKIFKKTLTKMIKAYYMCAQNGVVYKGYTELTGDNLAYVRIKQRRMQCLHWYQQ